MKYAFNGMDDILAKYLRKDSGFFVDIGAHDGIAGSNSKYLEEKGWDGICIEANPDVFKKLKENRKCRTENFAVWKEDVDLDFLVVTGYPEQLSGIVESYDPRHLNRVDREIAIHKGSKRIERIQGRKFDTIVDHRKVDFLSVDTEGSELQILMAIDFDNNDITVICVENNFNDPQIPQFLTSKGYYFKETVAGCDQIFAKN